MAATPALPGLLCCISALILLVFATISAPVWNDTSFLDITVNGKTTHFGTFGYTGSQKQLGYYIDSTVLGFKYVLPFPPLLPPSPQTRSRLPQL